MKTASISQMPEQWPQILVWVRTGEEVQLTDDTGTVARVLPPATPPPPTPDFLARARAIWGEQPAGDALSELVAEDRRTR